MCSWMDGLGMVKVYRDVREHSVGVLPTKTRLNVDFKVP